MGLSQKAQVEGAFDWDNNNSNRKWVIAGIALPAPPLKPIFTGEKDEVVVIESDEKYCSTTPTSVESKIPTTFTCPSAPKKRKLSLISCSYGRVVTQFFTPPDLETLFIRHVEKAN